MTTIRPEFEPDDASLSGAQSAVSPTLAWLRLMRLPNVFTAVADVAMGYLFVHGHVNQPAKLACLLAASVLLYTAGMVLNDVFDFEIDAKERPFRPLPSGQIGLATARAFGFTLLGLGIAFGWLAGYADADWAAIPWRSGLIATALAGTVLLYDGWLKKYAIGPLGMGLCRFLNVLLGMSAAQYLLAANGPLGFTMAELLAAAGIGVYIVGVTWFARSEAGESQGAALAGAIAVMACGVAILGFSVTMLPEALQPSVEPWIFWVLLGLLLLPVARRGIVAVFDPSAGRVQAVVKQSILTLILLDAATAAVVSSPLYALAIATLLAPALLLGRWVYST